MGGRVITTERICYRLKEMPLYEDESRMMPI